MVQNIDISSEHYNSVLRFGKCRIPRVSSESARGCCKQLKCKCCLNMVVLDCVSTSPLVRSSFLTECIRFWGEGNGGAVRKERGNNRPFSGKVVYNYEHHKYRKHFIE